jgi:hypothetical protein
MVKYCVMMAALVRSREALIAGMSNSNYCAGRTSSFEDGKIVSGPQNLRILNTILSSRPIFIVIIKIPWNFRIYIIHSQRI